MLKYSRLNLVIGLVNGSHPHAHPACASPKDRDHPGKGSVDVGMQVYVCMYLCMYLCAYVPKCVCID